MTHFRNGKFLAGSETVHNDPFFADDLIRSPIFSLSFANDNLSHLASIIILNWSSILYARSDEKSIKTEQIAILRSISVQSSKCLAGKKIISRKMYIAVSLFVLVALIAPQGTVIMEYLC